MIIAIEVSDTDEDAVYVYLLPYEVLDVWSRVVYCCLSTTIIHY